MLIADRVAGLGGLTVQAHCLSRHSHYPPPQPPAQLFLNQGATLWLTLENRKGQEIIVGEIFLHAQ